MLHNTQDFKSRVVTAVEQHHNVQVAHEKVDHACLT